MLGIKLSQLDAGTLREILFVYDQLIGGTSRERHYFADDNMVLNRTVEMINEVLNRSSTYAELRIGSSFAGEETNGKLFIVREGNIGEDQVIRFSYDPNFGRRCPEADVLARDFQTEINWFLFSRGLAVLAGDLDQRNKVDRLMETLEASNNDGSWIAGLLIKILEAREKVIQKSGNHRESRPLLSALADLQGRIERKGRALSGTGTKFVLEDKKKFVSKLAIIYEIIGWKE